MVGSGALVNKAEAQGSPSEVGCPECGPAPVEQCVRVHSEYGWQHFNFNRVYRRVTSVSGGWSVDAANYRRVGPSGHSEPGLEPYNQYKYDQTTPFGALLVNIPTDGYGYIWVRGNQQLPRPITRTAIRINDADNALGDNGGFLDVCFGI